ncbi:MULTISPECIES: amidohydrolase family protein [unclassified Fredinandcohnia]|uniref:amidohydrolase family protein n=1 Tax=unclassified Fredinandcohnia TaxID=2837514 RepID=UPI0030FD5955
MKYIIRGKKLITVSEAGTIENGGMLVENGLIKVVGTWNDLITQYPDVEVVDCSKHVITPSLVDCHTHLLEFAPTSLYPVTPETHFIAGKGILFKALSSGITAIGEQICGHPLCDFSISDYREAVADFPMDISFATTSISIGFEELAHFTSITESTAVTLADLTSSTLVKKIAENSDYPGENIFINATPANFTEDVVPKAGEIIYTSQQLQEIVTLFHETGKRIGCHVAGKKGIDLTLEAGFDVLHHAHGITDEQIDQASGKGIQIVATPMGGTHLPPNSPAEIKKLVQKQIPVSISTDAYLPPYPGVPWLPFQDCSLKGPDSLMLIAGPAMKRLKENYNENDILALLTANPARILGKEKHFGMLKPGLEANFLVAEGIPGLEITDVEQIKKIYYKGIKVIERG